MYLTPHLFLQPDFHEVYCTTRVSGGFQPFRLSRITVQYWNFATTVTKNLNWESAKKNLARY